MAELQLLVQPGGSIWTATAINWTGGSDPLKIGITPEAIKARASRGLRHVIGQMYGIVGTGLIHAQHVFQGLKRDMLVGDDDNAAQKKLAVTWATNRDAVYAGDKSGGRLEYMDAPENRVFAVYVSPNEMLEEFPDIFGWAEHWTWIAADPELSGAPIDWRDRYDSKIWSQGG